MSAPDKATPSNLSIRARPRAVTRFSRKALMGGVAVISVIMCGALAMALQAPELEDVEELYNVTHKPMAEGLELLPKSYDDIRPKLGPPLPGDLGAAYLKSDEDFEVATQQAVAEITSKPRRRASYSSPRQTTYNPPQPEYVAPPQTQQPSGLFFDVGRSKASRQAQQYAAVEPSSAYAGSLEVPVPNIADYSLPPSALNDFGSNSDPNGQSDKQAFLDKESDDIYNSHGLVSPRSPYQVMAGNLIPASLVTGLNSDLPGQVIGQVTENVFDTVTDG